MIFSRKFLYPKSERTTMSNHYLFSQILETPAEYIFKNNQPVTRIKRTSQTQAAASDRSRPWEGITAPRPMITPFSLRHTLLSWLVW